MNRAAEQPEPNPLREGLSARAVPQPCTIVIFGATGDLTQRKLIPALYNLAADGDLPPPSQSSGLRDGRKVTTNFGLNSKKRLGNFPARLCAMKSGKPLPNRSSITKASSKTRPVTKRWRNASTRSTRKAEPAATGFFISRLLLISSNRF